MLRRNQKVELIQKVPLFSSLSKGELAEVASIADEIDFREGKELIRQGARGREFFVLLDGAVDVTQDGRRINQLGPGDFFGEIALVAKTPRSATVEATSPVSALVIEARSFRALLEHSPQIQLRVLQSLAERVAQTA